MTPSARASSSHQAWIDSDEPTVARAYPEGMISGETTRPVETGQIEDVIPLSGRVRNRPPTTPSPPPAALPRDELGDDVSESFFDQGRRQEAAGYFDESPPAPRVSLDRIPWDHRGPLVLLSLILATGAVLAWWTGWSPPAVSLASLRQLLP